MTKIARAILIDELLRFAEEKGMRESGSNPIDSVRTMTVKARSRYITDSELRRIKVAMLRSSGQRADQINPAGQMTCAIVDMAYLTGQRIGDVLALQWTSVGRDGILFQPAKTEGSTGAQVLIEWTPRLRALIDRVKGGETPPHARYPPPAETVSTPDNTFRQMMMGAGDRPRSRADALHVHRGGANPHTKKPADCGLFLCASDDV